MPLYLLVLLITLAVCNGDYVGAVLEYTPITNYDPNITKPQAQKIMMDNLKQYEVQIANAKLQHAQIIVFPEYGMLLFIFHIMRKRAPIAIRNKQQLSFPSFYIPKWILLILGSNQ